MTHVEPILSILNIQCQSKFCTVSCITVLLIMKLKKMNFLDEWLWCCWVSQLFCSLSLSYCDNTKMDEYIIPSLT